AGRFDPAVGRPGELGLRFPIVLKPLTRRPESWDPVAGGAKALRVDTAAELAALWPRLAAAGLPLLAQQLVAGTEQRIESYHAYVRPGGEVVGEFTGRKIRTWPLERGESTALELTDAPDVAALGRDVLARLRFAGVAKLDFKRDPAGRLWLLEINPLQPVAPPRGRRRSQPPGPGVRGPDRRPRDQPDAHARPRGCTLVPAVGGLARVARHRPAAVALGPLGTGVRCQVGRRLGRSAPAARRRRVAPVPVGHPRYRRGVVVRTER